MTKKVIDVVTPDGRKTSRTERESAWILAHFYQTTVKILKESNRYKEQMPDFLINGEKYELKTPTSTKAQQIEKLINIAVSQAPNVVIDTRKTKITEKRMTEICQSRLSIKKLSKIVLIINKNKVLEFKK